MKKAKLGAVIALSLGATVFGTAEAAPQSPDPVSGSVEVRYTPYGVAHIKAATFEGAGYGAGWAFGRDNLCLEIDHALTLAGERSARFGPNATYFDGFAHMEAGADIPNIDSDAFYRAVLTARAVAKAKAYASPDLRGLVKGWTDGFNRHVQEPSSPGETCRGRPGFRRLTEDDVWRRALHIPFLETANLVLQEIADAAPPTGASKVRAAGKDADVHAPATGINQAQGGFGQEVWAGSNAAGFGRDMTANGRGVSFSNPHFPWSGIERLWAVQITVPGRYDVFGGALYGFPAPMMGFNQAMGWSITYVTDVQATIYRLNLDPQSPTRYRVGDHYEAMTPVVVAIPVEGGSGAGKAVSRTLWKTRYGYVLAAADLPWDRVHAYAFADPEFDDVRLGDQLLDMGRSDDVHDLKAALDRRLALPWSNVTAADARGETLYANISVSADIDDAKLRRCSVEGAASLGRKYHATVLDGSDAGCAWTLDPSSVQPGIVPASKRPWMFRTDVVLNSNDSHWLANPDPATALEGFPSTLGPERTLRGERTRMGMVMALGRKNGTDGLGAPGVTPGNWEALFFRSRNLMAELILDDLLADCRRHPKVSLGSAGGAVDLTDACDVLGRWDRTDHLDARGSVLFREFVNGLEHLHETGLKLAPRYWAVPFDPADPVGTPRGLKPTQETREALAKAINRLRSAGVLIDAPLRDLQFAERNGVKLPVSGSSYTYNVVIAPIGAGGLKPVIGGDSYMHIVGFEPDGPRGRFMVTYSQSTNPASPHFGDLTALFSTQSLADAPFTYDQIKEAQVGETIHFSLAAPGSR